MPRFLFVILFIQFVFSDLIVVGQVNNDCSTAQVICGSQSQLANNFGATVDTCPGCSDGATSAGNFCYEINNTVWFSFMTNTVGGDVTVSFSNLQCIVGNGIGNGLQATVITAGTPCNESTYNAVGNCEPGSVNDFTLLATNLLPNTTYFIQVDGAEGTASAAECSFTIMVSGEGVDVDVNAGENQVISEGQSAELVGTGPLGSVWSPNSSLSSTTNANTIATPEVSSTYTYSYTATNGCVYSDNVSVIIEQPIIITNTFTPNEDGINDYWEIIDAEKYQAIKITVFDRWGQKVFNTIGYSSEKRWNGTFLNKDVPPGVYFYSIDLNEGNKEEVFTGYVTVIR
jgi:gliding motility-associated-like protein